ncbi:hypothetical protein ACFLTD_00190 [Elusimicrobiota bacterium]
MVHIAKYLKEKGYLEKAYAFIAYYDEWRDYLHKQKNVEFEKIIGTKEIYERMTSETVDYKKIKRIENEYGYIDLELWNIIYSDPYLSRHTHYRPYNHPAYTRDDVLKYVQASFGVIEGLFSEVRVDAVVDFARVCILRGAIDLVAQRYDIPYLFPHHALLANRYLICRRIRDEYKNVRKTYEDLLSSQDNCEKGYEYLRWARDADTRTVYSSNALAKKKKISNIRRSARYLKKVLSWVINMPAEIVLRCKSLIDPSVRFNFQFFKNLPSIKLYRELLGFIRRIMIFFKRPFEDSDIEGDFAFMTLHLKPEASTSILAPFFVNQEAVIRNISRALPLSWKLVVKPNINMKGIEPLSFYKRIQSIPNVCLVGPESDTQNMIKRSKAVITITGTSGLEAVLKGKKVIVLSSQPIWSVIKGVTVCTDMTELSAIFKNIDEYTPDDHNLAAYLQAVHDNSFPLEKNYIWKGPYELSNDGYRKAIELMSDNIIKEYERNLGDE